ncbi:hypothetical protein LPJ60_006358, partial [Coemansia sp. RSA 2675]
LITDQRHSASTMTRITNSRRQASRTQRCTLTKMKPMPLANQTNRTRSWTTPRT